MVGLNHHGKCENLYSFSCVYHEKEWSFVWITILICGGNGNMEGEREIDTGRSVQEDIEEDILGDRL